MKRALAIARKELTVFFTTPWAYWVLAAVTFLSSYVFINLIDEFHKAQKFAQEKGWQRLPADMRNVTDGIVISYLELLMLLTLFIAPFLSMRLFAEEKRNKTFELLFTAPVRTFDIVLGKYLGGLGSMVSVLAVTWVYPLVLSWVSSAESGQPVEWSTVAVGYTGLLLLGATCMAVGMWLSSMTDSQMLAAVLTFALLLPWTLLGWLAQNREEPLRSILNHLSFQTQLSAMLRGAVETQSLVYFASVIAGAFILTHLRLATQKESFLP